MLALTKLLGMLCMPLGLLWLGLALAAAWALRRRLRGPGAFLVLLFLGLTLAGNLQVGAWLMGRLESEVPPLSEHSAPFDALFVLGGGSQIDDQGRPLLSTGGDRIVEAARLLACRPGNLPGSQRSLGRRPCRAQEPGRGDPRHLGEPGHPQFRHQGS